MMQSVDDTETFLRPLTAQEAVLAELRKEILEGVLKPGTQIRQELVAQRLGFSRVPVREALKTLEGESLVSYLPRRGYFVAALDFEELAEIYNIRRLLEAEAVRLAMPNLTHKDIERMELAVHDIEKAGVAGQLIPLNAANRNYHFALFEPSGHQRLVRIIGNLWDASDPYRSLYFTGLENREAVNREHRQILAAVENADVNTVVALLQVHRDHALQELRRVLKTP